MRKRLLRGSVLGLIAAVFCLNVAHAAGPKPTITISPFLGEVRIAADEPTKDFKVELSNLSDESQSFKLSIIDFGSLNESGGVVFAGSDSSDLIKKYGLASWLSLSSSELSIPANQSAEVTATIINDVSLTPGGHYAAIIASVNNPSDGTGNSVAIDQKLSSLILATKVGGEKYDLKLDSIENDGNWLHLPNKIALHFSNPGNVHVVPRGTVKLLNPSSKIVAQGVINEDSSFVLPETERILNVDLKSESSSSFLPGLYHIRVDYRYDGVNDYARREQALFYTNIPGLITLLVLVLGLGWVVMHRKRLRNKAKNSSKK